MGCRACPRASPISKFVHTYIYNGKASRLPGAACLWQPCHVPIYIGIGIGSSRPGAGCLSPIISLYMCIHTYKKKQAACLGWGAWASSNISLSTCRHTYGMGSNQPAWGRLPGATLPCLYIHAYVHTNCESKQPALGGLPGPDPYHLYKCEHMHKTHG